jgi:intraflagellar transport protein 80
VCDLDAFVTAMHFSPAPRSADASAAAFAAACSDGTLRFFLRNGRLEKTVEAHAGAVTSVRWTKDGSCVLTAGEDGAVKSWSPGGRLRGVVAAGETAVYAAAWSPESHASGGETGRVVVARGKNLRMHFANKSVGAETATTEPSADSRNTASTPAWRAHDGVVLAVDWCAVSELAGFRGRGPQVQGVGPARALAVFVRRARPRRDRRRLVALRRALRRRRV